MRMAFVVPGRFDDRSGGSIYNRRIVEGLRARGREVDVVEVDGAADAARAFDALAPGTRTVVDGLLFGEMPEVALAQAGRLRLVALVHLPLAAHPGISDAEAARRRASEQQALTAARHVVITGAAARPLLDGYGVEDRLTLVEPGTDRPDPAALEAARRRRLMPAAPVRLLSAGTINPGKGHVALLRALARTGGDWHLTIAGSLTRHPDTVLAVRTAIADLGLRARVTLRGDLDQPALAQAYADADAFALATLRETYGMATAEALAWELPVVATATGAIPDLVGTTAGIVVPVGDEAALTAALTRILEQPALRAELARGAADAAKRLPSWHDQVGAFLGVLDALA